jgi:hypothetical protein
MEGQEDINDFFQQLLNDDVNSGLLGDVVDLDVLLAQKLSLEEETDYERWLTEKYEMEQKDRALALRLSEHLSSKDSSNNNNGINNNGINNINNDDESASLALALQLTEQDQANVHSTNPHLHDDSSLALAMMLAEDERERQRMRDEDASLALIEELKHDYEFDSHTTANDAVIAAQLQKELNTPPTPPPAPPMPYNAYPNPIVPAPEDDRPLTESFEGILDNDLKPFCDLNLNVSCK